MLARSNSCNRPIKSYISIASWIQQQQRDNAYGDDPDGTKPRGEWGIPFSSQCHVACLCAPLPDADEAPKRRAWQGAHGRSPPVVLFREVHECKDISMLRSKLENPGNTLVLGHKLLYCTLYPHTNLLHKKGNWRLPNISYNKYQTKSHMTIVPSHLSLRPDM